MRRRSAVSVFVLLALLAGGLGLTACTSSAPEDVVAPGLSETQEPSTSSTAVARTDAAVASATEAVRSYYAVTDRLLSDPQASVDETVTVASGEELDALRRQVQSQRINGLRQTGAVELSDVVATGADLQEPPTVTIDVCADVSALDVVDASGASVLAGDRPQRSVVHLTVVDTGDRGWLVDQTSAQGEACAG